MGKLFVGIDEKWLKNDVILATGDGCNGPFKALVPAGYYVVGSLPITRLFRSIHPNELLGNEHDIQIVRVSHVAAVRGGREHRFNFDGMAAHFQYVHVAPRFVKTDLIFQSLNFGE